MHNHLSHGTENVNYIKKNNIDNNNYFHQAGYDAYCTGVIFIKMCGLLAKYNYINLQNLPFDMSKNSLQDLIKMDIERFHNYKNNERPSINNQFWKMLKQTCAEKWNQMEKMHKNQLCDMSQLPRVRVFDQKKLAKYYEEQMATNIQFYEKHRFFYPLSSSRTCVENVLYQMSKAMNYINTMDNTLGVRLDNDMDDMRSYFT